MVIEIIPKIIPDTNFQILTPEANMINTPKRKILNAVPKSGWAITTSKRAESIKESWN